jgi:putative ABC transport system ATP-binding protein
MNVIGLLDRPSQGVYKLDTRNVSRLRSAARAKVRRDKIGFIFQSFNLLPRMTVIENVALPLAYKGITNVRRLHRSSELLEKIGLKTREYYFPRQLSGGQLQRVAIARALINKPSILIADEPTGNLDSASNKVVMNLLRDIHKGGNTIIMVTHNVELTAYASRVVYMIDGHIHQDKPLRENETADIFKLHNAPSIDKTKRGQKKSKVKK